MMSSKICISCLHYNEYYGKCMKTGTSRKSTAKAKSCFLSLSDIQEDEVLDKISASVTSSFGSFDEFLKSNIGKQIQAMLDDIDEKQVYLGDSVYDWGDAIYHAELCDEGEISTL